MMSARWASSRARARASRGMRRVSDSMSASSARPCSRSSLSMIACARSAQRLDRAEPHKPDGLAQDHGQQRQAREHRERKARCAEPGRAREQILDDARDREPKRRSATSPDSADQNSAPQRHAAALARRSRRRRQTARSTPPRPRLRRRGSSGAAIDEPRIVDAEHRGLARLSRSSQPVPDQELQRAVEANVRQRRDAVAASSSAGGGSDEAQIEPGNRPGSANSAGRLGRSPGKQRDLGAAVESAGRRSIRRGRAMPTIDGRSPPSPRTSASRVARTAASAITSTSAPAIAGPRDGARRSCCLRMRLQPVVRGVVQLVGLGRRKQDAVGASARNSALSQAAAADPEAIEHRDHAPLAGRAPPRGRRRARRAHRPARSAGRGGRNDRGRTAAPRRRDRHRSAAASSPRSSRTAALASGGSASGAKVSAGEPARSPGIRKRPGRQQAQRLVRPAAGLQIAGEQPRRLDRGDSRRPARADRSRRARCQERRCATARRVVRRRCASVSADHCS